jgi:DNA-binding MarR family transcriptional regulator
VSDEARLVATARLFGRAVGIVDPLRLRLWTECGLTMSQLRLMLLMGEQPGVTHGALAERFHVHASTITGHVEKLMQRGLVRRVEDDQDRRVQHNYLTEEGAGLVGQIERTAGKFIIGLLQRLSPEQVERLALGLQDLLAVAADDATLDFFNKEAIQRIHPVADTA